MTAQSMSKTTQVAGHERAKCPHCQALQPDEASAYVIPGTNVIKQDACESCGKRFSIAELPTGQFRITPLHTPVKATAPI